jgi:hypothetical protein
MPVNNAFRYQLHQLIMGNGVEILGDIGIDYIQLALKKVSLRVVYRLMSIPFRSESVRVVMKVGFKYRLDYHLYGHLHHPVFDREDSE